MPTKFEILIKLDLAISILVLESLIKGFTVSIKKFYVQMNLKVRQMLCLNINL